jgi:outer membrane protein assembly factor BamB
MPAAVALRSFVTAKSILWGYKGETTDLIELLTCLDAKTGKKLWEHEIADYLSDSIYNRYSIGAPTVDPETKRIYLVSNAGTFYCYELDGKKVFEMPLMEDLGRMTFPNSPRGQPGDRRGQRHHALHLLQLGR